MKFVWDSKNISDEGKLFRHQRSTSKVSSLDRSINLLQAQCSMWGKHRFHDINKKKTFNKPYLPQLVKILPFRGVCIIIILLYPPTTRLNWHFLPSSLLSCACHLELQSWLLNVSSMLDEIPFLWLAYGVLKLVNPVIWLVQSVLKLFLNCANIGEYLSQKNGQDLL